MQTAEEVLTGYEGVYIAGDLADHRYRKAVAAAGSGCKAALEARVFLLVLQFGKCSMERHNSVPDRHFPFAPVREITMFAAVIVAG